MKEVLDQKTSELLKIEMVAEETNKVLNQAIDEKETALSEREVLDKQNLDLKEEIKGQTQKRKQAERTTQAEDAANRAREDFNAVFDYMIKTTSELCRLKKRDAALDAKATALDDKELLL